MNSIIRDINLAPTVSKIEWVKRNMPILNSLEQEFKKTRPFEGIRISLSIHLEAKTAYLSKVLAAGGAQMAVTGSNPLPTQDDVAAALVEDGINVYSWYDCTRSEYDKFIDETLSQAILLSMMAVTHTCTSYLKSHLLSEYMEGVKKPPPAHAA